MTDMIEKMARAIHAASYHPDDLNNSIVAEHWEVEKGKALKRAKAALSALEDPSIEMLSEGYMPIARLQYNGSVGVDTLRECWAEMIKAAKGEE